MCRGEKVIVYYYYNYILYYIILYNINILLSPFPTLGKVEGAYCDVWCCDVVILWCLETTSCLFLMWLTDNGRSSPAVLSKQHLLLFAVRSLFVFRSIFGGKSGWKRKHFGKKKAFSLSIFPFPVIFRSKIDARKIAFSSFCAIFQKSLKFSSRFCPLRIQKSPISPEEMRLWRTKTYENERKNNVSNPLPCGQWGQTDPTICRIRPTPKCNLHQREQPYNLLLFLKLRLNRTNEQ